MVRMNLLVAAFLAGLLPAAAMAAQAQAQPDPSAPNVLNVERGKVWFNRGPHAVVVKKDEPMAVLPGDRMMLLHDSRAFVTWNDGKKTKLYSCDLFIVGAPSADAGDKLPDAGEKNSVVRIDAMYRHKVGYYVGDDDSGDRCFAPWIWFPGAAVIGAMLLPGPEHSSRGVPISSP
jgi:hypothetical protein